GPGAPPSSRGWRNPAPCRASDGRNPPATPARRRSRHPPRRRPATTRPGRTANGGQNAAWRIPVTEGAPSYGCIHARGTALRRKRDRREPRREKPVSGPPRHAKRCHFGAEIRHWQQKQKTRWNAGLFNRPRYQPPQPSSLSFCPGRIAYFGALMPLARARPRRSQLNLRTIADRVSPRRTVWDAGFGADFGTAGAGLPASPVATLRSPTRTSGVRTSAACTLLSTSCCASFRRWPRVQWRWYSQAMRVVASSTVPVGMVLSTPQRGLRLRSARR